MDTVVLVWVFFTALLSGVFGMAGGMLLLLVLLSRLPVAEAMVLHGVAQLCSNAMRTTLLFAHVRLATVGYYSLGGLAVLLAGAQVSLVVPAYAALLLVGLIPLSEPLWRERLRPPSLTTRGGALVSGLFVSVLHLAAGTPGPLLDALFLRTDFDKAAIVATKAAMQSVGHLTKVAYFAIALGTLPASLDVGITPWLWLFAVSTIGTAFGRAILDRLSERTFRRGVRILVIVLASAAVARGLHLLAWGVSE